MAAIFQIRRGTTDVSLTEGELYLHQTSGSLQIGSGSSVVTMAKLNEPNIGNFNVSGDITIGGTITIGDNTSDNVVFNADLSSSIIPNATNTYDLGASDKAYRNVYATSISGAIAATNGILSGSSQIIGILDSLNSFSGSQLTQNTELATITGSLITSASTAKTTNDAQDISITNLNTNSASVNTSVEALNSLTNSYATTGSNSFNGNQTITGSLTVSGSSTFRNIGPTILSGSVLVSGSINSDGYELEASLTETIPALNSTFNLDFSGSESTIIKKSLVLGDGKILVAGRFTSVDGHTTNDIARLNSNGTIDTSFSSPVFSTTIEGDTGGYINTFVTQSDGKIVVGGNFTRVSGISRAGLARLDANGSLDTSFAVQSWGSFGEIRDIVIQNDNKIVCVGSFPSGSRRVNPDGTIDTSLVVSTSPGFGDDNFYSVALLPSGSEQAILIGGDFQQWNTYSDYHHLVKLHPSGALDFGFAGTNLDIATGNSLDRIQKIKVTDAYTAGDNGYIYIAGRFKDTRIGAQGRNAGFARLTTDDVAFGRGAYDNGFRLYISGSDQNTPGVQYVNDFDFYDGDKILLGGSFTSLGNPLASYQTTKRFIIVDTDNGSLVDGFSSSNYNLNTGSVNSVTLIPSTTNVLVGGTFTQANSTAREGLASLKLAGLGNVTTTSDYSITANVNELLISSSNTYFTGNITASVISGAFVGDGSGLTGVTAGDVEFANISNKPTLISGSSQLNGTTITDLTIINLITINETASVIYSSGSNRFGDAENDTHSFTGSVEISGSFATIGTVTATTINGTINATNGIVSGSSQIIGILDSLNSFSGSQLTQNTELGNYTGSVNVSITNINTTTASLNSYTQSVNSDLVSIHQTTASLNLFSASVTSSLDSIYQTTASIHLFSASVTASLVSIYETTASLNTSISNLNIFSSSYYTDSASFDTRINTLDPGNIAGSFIALNNFTSSFSQSVSASIAGLASASGYINYVTNSIEQLTGIEVADFDNNVAVTFIGGTLKFIFGTPAVPTSIVASLSGFASDRFNNVNDAYIVNGTWSNQGYTLVSASLYEGSTLLTEVGSGTSLSFSTTTSGSHSYRLEYTASSPLDGTLYKTSTTTTGTVSKSSPASPTITPTVTVQLGATSNQIEQGATGSISFTSASSDPSNGWDLVNTTTNVDTPYYVTGSATGSTSISIIATANYESPIGDNIPDLTTTSTATTTYTKIRSLRYGASDAASFTAGELENIGAWDTTLGGSIGTIAKGTTTASGQSVTISWTGDKYHYIVFNSSLSNLSNITTSGFGVLGQFSVTTVGQYKVYKTNTLQAGGAGSSITYTLT